MAHTFEAVTTVAGKDLFLEGAVQYMEQLDYTHVNLGGRLGEQMSHEFRRDDHVVTITVSGEGQSHFKLVVDSETAPVEPLVLDILTQGVADYLEPFCQVLSEGEGEKVLSSLVDQLRTAIVRILDKDE